MIADLAVFAISISIVTAIAMLGIVYLVYLADHDEEVTV